jgi:Type IX secretion system protein PorV
MKKLNLLAAFALAFHFLFAQCDPITGLNPNGQPCGGTIQTAVPFLRLVPDARSGGMGDVGIALTPDANSILYNTSNTAFSDKNWGASLNYTPNNIAGSKNIFLLHSAGYRQFGREKKRAVAVGMRYFSLGNVQWIDFNGGPIGEGTPYEMEFAAAYSTRLSEKWSLGATAKYIYSSLATGLISPTGESIRSGRAGAIDISATYRKNITLGTTKNLFTFAPVISNLGNKITYLKSEDFLPTNLGIGMSWQTHFNNNHSVLVVVEANKLLVPTPNPADTNWRSQSPIRGALGSFSDAPNGASEEWEEVTYSTGLEYRFRDILALRSGYFYEHPSKGGRKYWTLGAGVAYKMFGFNVSYRQNLNNLEQSKWRFSLLLNFQDANRG